MNKTTRNWKDFGFQRKFLDDLGKKLNISKPQEWASVSAKTIIQNGGNSVLNHHGRSVRKMLMEVYPGCKKHTNK